MNHHAPIRETAFNREYVEELRRENQRKGERIRILVESLASMTAERNALRTSLSSLPPQAK